MSVELQSFISGALAAGYLIVALLFLRFWRNTRDRLFAYFAAAFTLLSIQTTALAVPPVPIDDPAWLYVVRVLAYLLILVAIYDKNRARTSVPATDAGAGTP